MSKAAVHGKMKFMFTMPHAFNHVLCNFYFIFGDAMTSYVSKPNSFGTQNIVSCPTLAVLLRFQIVVFVAPELLS